MHGINGGGKAKAVGIQVAEKTRAEELHDEYRRKIWEDTKSGTENFDKYMLTFSSGALALSLGFIKDVVTCPPFLVQS